MELLDNAATCNTSLVIVRTFFFFSLEYTKFYDEGKSSFVFKTK